MEAAQEVQKRLRRRRESRQLVVSLAISQRRAGGAPPLTVPPQERTKFGRSVSRNWRGNENPDALSSVGGEAELMYPFSPAVSMSDWCSRAPFGAGMEQCRPCGEGLEKSRGVLGAEGGDELCALRHDALMDMDKSGPVRCDREAEMDDRWSLSSSFFDGEAGDVEDGGYGHNAFSGEGSGGAKEEDVVGLQTWEGIHLDEAAILRRVYDYL